MNNIYKMFVCLTFDINCYIIGDILILQGGIRMKKIKLLSIVLSLFIVIGAGCSSPSGYRNEEVITEIVKTDEPIKTDYSEMTAEEIVATLTNEQKAYQMVIPAIYNMNDSDMQKNCYGSVLSQYAPTEYDASEWRKQIDTFQKRALSSDAKIPFIYGQDSVHGVNYCLNTVIFPHNINIGCANDEELTYKMSLAVADEIKLTKMIWNYSPCVAVAEDPRWGRTYESYSSDPEIVKNLSAAYVKGQIESGIVVCAKHYIGDGSVTFGTGENSDGTNRLIDRGNAELTDEEIKEQLAIYKTLVDMDVQSIMVSHSALNGTKMHENKYYLIDVLRNELGFEGVVVSDWNSIQNIESTKDYKEQIIIAVNSGIDWLMEPDTADQCAKYLVEAVEEGKISQERMDEAVTRIIQLKIDAGLFEDPYLTELDTVQDKVGSEEYRALAEELVEKSQVLIKNENNILPLEKGTKIFVTGPALDDSGIQCGGWTREWNGRSDKNWSGEFIQGTTTILEGLEQVAEEYDLTIITDEKLADTADVTLLCIGENPYAEWNGDTADLSITGVLSANGNKESIALAKSLGKPTITLIVAGRNVIIEEYKNDWDGIVMCGLPGTEGKGVADVLVGDAEFSGKLSMPWYSSVNDIENEKVWLDVGYGITTEKE